MDTTVQEELKAADSGQHTPLSKEQLLHKHQDVFIDPIKLFPGEIHFDLDPVQLLYCVHYKMSQ